MIQREGGRERMEERIRQRLVGEKRGRVKGGKQGMMEGGKVKRWQWDFKGEVEVKEY